MNEQLINSLVSKAFKMGRESDRSVQDVAWIPPQHAGDDPGGTWVLIMDYDKTVK